MKFGTFFFLNVTHEYLDGNPCPYLSIEPTPACTAVLQQYGLLFNQNRQGDVTVLTKLDENGYASTKVDKPLEFDFFVYAPEKDFLIFTKLPQKKWNEVYLFSNQNSERDQPLNIATNVTQKPGSAFGKALFGLIKIRKDSSVPTTYRLAFEAAAVKWKYYLIANSSVTDLLIDGKLSELTFKKTGVDNNTEADAVAKTILNGNPGSKLFVFESDKPVPYRHTGRKNIQLVDGASNAVLINHLPNPDFTDNGIKIIRANT